MKLKYLAKYRTTYLTINIQWYCWDIIQVQILLSIYKFLEIKDPYSIEYFHIWGSPNNLSVLEK